MKILVATSGGVDSSVTAYMLKNQGHEIIACYMKLHGKEAYHQENIQKVARVAKFLNISYHVLDLQDEFKDKVYMPFVNTYKEGKTPNPCALCNRFIKLGKLLEFAKQMKCDKLATGHYARLENGLIKTAFDETKDQSYFLASASKNALKDVIFPLGDMKKEEVKKIASGIKELESFATQKESAEICFVEDTYTNVLNKFMNTNIPGEVLNQNGEKIGTHQGYMHYTIGKRRGFVLNKAHTPHFVIDIKPKSNQIIVGSKDDLRKDEFELENLNLFIDEKIINCEVKVRYRSKSIPCTLNVNALKVDLKEPVYGIASSQMAVFYNKDLVIASGFIR